MASLSDLLSSPVIKILYIGDSATGKTGSLVSLVEAGYRLRIIDLDNGIKTLAEYVRHRCPDKLDAVEFISPRDKYKTTPMGIAVSGAPKAFKETMTALEKWTDGTDPSKWDPSTILVIDSLTALGKAAYNWFSALNPDVKDKRQVFYSAQDAVESVLQNVTADEFGASVIVISHIEYNEERTKGHASALGKALGPKIPRHFNNLILAESKGSGENTRRVIRTVPTGVVDLKTEAPFRVAKELPLETGMATIFSLLKNESAKS